MKISVVTVVLNAASTIEQTMDSVQGQNHDEIEHIVIDGGSTDGTNEILQRHADKISRLMIEPDKGIYDAMNKGIAMATGDIIGFLNADDVFDNDSILSKICNVFSDQTIMAAYANLVYVKSDDIHNVVRYWQSQDYRPGLFEKGWMPAHPTFYVRREIYEKYGGFDLNYQFHADYAITAKFMAVKQIKTKFVAETWVRMRMGGSSNRSLANIIRGNLESYDACKKLGLNMSPMYFVTKFLMRLPQFFRRP